MTSNGLISQLLICRSRTVASPKMLTTTNEKVRVHPASPAHDRGRHGNGAFRLNIAWPPMWEPRSGSARDRLNLLFGSRRSVVAPPGHAKLVVKKRQNVGVLLDP